MAYVKHFYRTVALASLLAVSLTTGESAYASCTTPSGVLGEIIFDDSRFRGCTTTGWKYLDYEETVLTLSQSTWAPIAAGGTLAVDVTSNQTWTVTSNQPWLTFTPATGTGNGSVTLTAANNTGAARTATLTVMGGALTQTVTVNQAATCLTGLVTNANTVCLGNGVDICPGNRYLCLNGDMVVYLGLHASTHLFTTYAGFESLPWKTSNTGTPGTSSNTDGEANTNAMATAGLSAHPAGKACRDLGSQWFLPAKDELNALYTLSSHSPLSAMVRLANYYWASTQLSATNAWLQDLSSGYQLNDNKTYGTFVRCLRR